jgi:hypothetical protein
MMEYTYEEVSNEVVRALIEAEYVDQITDRVWKALKDRQEQEGTTDPYLQPGWPCEVWDNNRAGETVYVLRYYTGVSDSELRFSEWNDGCADGANTWDYYRPIGTEWDFAPEWADRLVIEPFGSVTFYGGMTESQTVRIKTVLPEEYWGKTIPRPKWAKEVSE